MSSQKINAKNLTYSQNVPPFLAALRGQASGQTGPDPILAARRRPTKQRSASEEAEDAPLVLNDRGDVVTGVTIGTDGAATVAGATDKQQHNEEEERRESKLGESCAAGIGVGKKRKMGKFIGVSEEGEEKKEQRRSKHIAKDWSEEKSNEDAKNVASASKVGTKDKKKRKGIKKIKMSFEDDSQA